MRLLPPGLTRAEVLVLIGCLLLLTGIVVPASRRERTFALRAVSYAQAEPIARAVRAFLDDARLPPQEGGHFAFVGPGERPAGLPSGTILSLELLRQPAPPPELASKMRGPWHGPYKFDLAPDSWGRAFVVTSVGDPGLITWCLSAGENGKIDTGPGDYDPSGDDAGVRLR